MGVDGVGMGWGWEGRGWVVMGWGCVGMGGDVWVDGWG